MSECKLRYRPHPGQLIVGTALLCSLPLLHAQELKIVAPPLAAQASEEDTKQKLVPRAANRMSAEIRKMLTKSGREIEYFLPIQYTNGKIYNPATGKPDSVYLRSYGRNLSGNNLLRPAFVAPTVHMKPGQTVRFDLSNRLPAEPDCGKVANINTPHCFNTTNLHSHGLWISPAGNSDNVLLAIKPNVNFEYEYNVPADHPAGTFWYHPHVHGSTAIQVGSGMAGALIIKGDRFPTPLANGDLDTLLRPFQPVNGNYSDLMLLQQIPYACFVDSGEKDPQTGKPKMIIRKAIMPYPSDSSIPNPWVCNPDEVGVVEDFNLQFGPRAWGQSGRHTLINGVARNPQQPMQMEVGKVYRWRLIDAGVHNTISLRIRKVGDASKLAGPQANSQAVLDNEAQQACTGQDVSQFEVASDGLTREQIFEKVINTLQPGYRSDVLFTLPEPGKYCVYDAASSVGTVMAGGEDARLLAVIEARGNRKIVSQKQHLTQELLRAAGLMPKNVREQIQQDLKNGLKLSRFVPHASISKEEISASGLPLNVVDIGIDFTVSPIKFQVNGKAYEPNQVGQKLMLGKAQEWQLRAVNPQPPTNKDGQPQSTEAGVAHPFHIHVNPFQIVAIKDESTGQEIGNLTDTTHPKYGQYAGMLGTWRDTLMLTPGITILTRTRYQRYIGEFVLHCHILDHEDQGMMQNVEVVLPDGTGGVQGKGHH